MNDKNKKVSINQDFLYTNEKNLYENNNIIIIKPPVPPPPPTTKSQLSPDSYMNIKKCEFKSNNKIDFDDFLNKVMNDVMTDFSKHGKQNEKQNI